MNVCCLDIIREKKPMQDIENLKKAGFENICLNIGVRFPVKGDKPEAEKDITEYCPENITMRYRELIRVCKENDISFTLAHAPYAFIQSGGPDILELLEKSVEESIKLCQKAGCRYLIVMPPYQDPRNNREAEINHAFYLRSAKQAQKYDICLLLRNYIKVIGGHMVRGLLSEPRQAIEYINTLNSEAGSDIFGFCLDTDVCTMCGNDMNVFAATLGRYLKAVVLSDSDGYAGGGMLPFTYAPGGVVQTDWLGLIRGLRKIDFDGVLAIQSSGTKKAFPLMLSSEILRLSKLVGDYFRWQIQIEQNIKKYKTRVLFGAGNMCRNYMKNYGEKYPPLYTCDNNSKLWGTIFEGIEVKSPEELKKLPADCGIFICNIYYSEIEAQLREMGIENIEYFNDEYMPSYYFDRLEMWEQ